VTAALRSPGAAVLRPHSREILPPPRTPGRDGRFAPVMMAWWSLLTCLLVVLWPITSPGAGGWYLMEPPLKPCVTGSECLVADSGAPLRLWRNASAHDTAKECEAAKVQEIAEAEKTTNEFRRHPEWNLTASGVALAWPSVAREALCIASDDPRLKR
jgi:hypothetical protein